MLILYSTRTNEIFITLAYERSKEPLTGANVVVELLDNTTLADSAIAASLATLSETSTPGTYYAKYPILAEIEGARSYLLHIVVKVNGSPVIDEVFADPVETK